MAGPDVFETNQANACYGNAVDKFRPKRCWKLPSQDFGIDPEIDEYAAVNDAADDGDSHRFSSPDQPQAKATVNGRMWGDLSRSPLAFDK